MGYLPVDFMKHGEHAIRTMTNVKMPYEEHKHLLDDSITREQFIEYVVSKKFLAGERPEFKKFDQYIIDSTPTLIEALGLTLNDIKERNINLITEWKDTLIANELFNDWSKAKQVYKPDADFAKALILTERIRMHKDMMTHLPVNSFYLDLSNLNLKDIHGCFVFVHNVDGQTCLSTYVLTYDEIYFSNYIIIPYKDNGEVDVDVSLLADSTKNKIAPGMSNFENEGAIVNLDKTYELSAKTMSTMILQILLYMGVAEPDIEESAMTKSTYRPRKPGEPVKNKFSEVQIYEMGYRYGTNFRKKMKEAGLKEIKFMSSTEEKEEERHHASPIPHLRCAHYHTYWCGAGRTEKILKWIEPVFVGFGGKNAEIATIHKIGKH